MVKYFTIQNYLENSLQTVSTSLAAEYLGMSPSSVRNLVTTNLLDAIIIKGKKRSWTLIEISILKEYKKKSPDQPEVYDKIKKILLEIVIKKEVIYYSDLLEKIGFTFRNPVHRRLIKKYLSLIDEFSLKEYNLLLSNVVILKGTNLPNSEFFEGTKEEHINYLNKIYKGIEKEVFMTLET